MINKKHYKKVLEKTDSRKFQEVIELSKLLKNASPTILDITGDLLGIHVKYGSSNAYSEDVNSAFENYVRVCLHYIAMKSYVKDNDKMFDNIEKSYVKDNDKMFDNIEKSYVKDNDKMFDNIEKSHVDDICDKSNSPYIPTNIQNCWGKGIKKSV
jgi:hypothetical protein